MDPIALDTIDYTVELWDINNVFIADITRIIATDIRIDMPLNDTEEVAFTLDLVQFEELCASIGARPINILEPYRTDVKIRRNGEYLVGAHVVHTNVNFNATDTNKIEVQCTGYLNHLKDRYLSARYYNMTYAGIARQMITDTQAGYNLIKNGDFFEGMDGWQYIDAGYVVWDALTGNNVPGSLFASVTTGSLGYGGARWQRNMQSGVTYTLSYWVKPVTGGGSTYIRTAVGTNMNTTVIPTTSWTQVSYTWTQGAASSFLDIEMSGNINFWLDDVRLTDNIDNATTRNFGITLGTDTAIAGQSATRVRNYDLQSVKDGIINLTKLENDNFDFSFDANKVFRTYARKGTDKAHIELVYPQNITSIKVTRSAQKLANKVYALGSGIGNERLETSAIDYSSALTYRVRETVEMFNSVIQLNTLTANAMGVLDERKSLDDNIDVQVTNNALDLDLVELGDAIYVRVDGSAYVDYVNGLYRIVKISLSVTREFEENITLELQKWD
jgi:hypothetical protein